MEEKIHDDMKLITFYRRAIYNDTSAISNTNRNGVMSTDYFDVIESLDFNVDGELIDITKLIDKQLRDSESIAMHSYPIYCYGNDTKNYKNYKNYDNPLGNNDKDMPFLSIIEVHITPEVIASLSTDNNSGAFNYIDMFFDDLHNIIDAFAVENSDCHFIYKIYRSLSVGDFFVIIKSALEDTSFKISTLFRRRSTQNTNSKKGEYNLVMYKTYTILCVYNAIIQTDTKEAENKGNETLQSEEIQTSEKSESCFAIRCCYSNKYWSEKPTIDDLFKNFKEDIDKKIARLNGRYDISIILDRNKFIELLPLIAKYKGIVNFNYTLKLEDDIKTWSSNINSNKSTFDIVNYLGFLLINGYISYVNERFLINLSEKEPTYLNKISSNIFVESSENKGWLSEYNKKAHDILCEQFKHVNKRMKTVNSYRKNLMYYMSLIDRLIKLCLTINGLSDTRIYSYILMNQLGTLLNGIEYYIDIINDISNESSDDGSDDDSDSNTCSIMDNLDEYIRRSIHALDSYACYIRNNNLQALQAPNYNLEGNFSIEKYLIGYSEFLEIMINRYNSIVKSEKYNIGEIGQKVIPVFEPDSLHDAVSVNVLFRERDEKEIKGVTNRLMLVRCSTFKEMVNVPEISTLLFHELAHQFRYESRKERNDFLVRGCTELCFNIVISKLVEKVQSELQWLEPEEKTIRFIGLKLTEAYLEKVYTSKDDLSYSYSDKSLYSFKRCYMDTLNAIYNKTVYINKLRQLLTAAIEARKFDIDISVNNIRSDICKLSTLENDIKALSGKTISQDFGNLINEAVSAANNLKMNKLEEGLKEFLNNRKAMVECLEYDFIMEDIWEDAYDKILTGKEEFKDDPILRYLGLDYGHDDNKKEFAKQISGIFNTNRVEIFDSMENYIAAYREVTADMFMCKILELNIFGYLDCVMRDIPIDRVISNEFLTRFIYVIYFVYIDKGQGDSIYNFDDCKEFKFLKAGIDSSVEFLNSKCDLKNGELKFDFDGDTPEELADKCNDAAKMLYNKDDDNKSNKEDDDTGNDDYFAKEYMHYDKMYLLLSQLKISWNQELVKIEKDENIVNDLKKGNEALKNIRIDFFDKKIDTNSFDENLERYCNSFRDYWNKTKIRYGESAEKMAELNNTVINFVQYMYYKNKLKNAKQCYEWGLKYVHKTSL